MNTRIAVQFTVNDRHVRLEVEARRSLADVLREECDLTGTHLGCEHGICGACTVVVDGEPVRSCLMLAAQAAGCHVETVEGLAQGEILHPLQSAFISNHGLQCGFCTPGFLMLAAAVLRNDPNIADDELMDVMSSNLCRCTGYQNIKAAVRAAAAEMRAGHSGEHIVTAPVNHDVRHGSGLIGESVTRLEDEPLVRGQGRFAADISFPHQVHMRIVRSAHAHGVIDRIDTTAARALPGIVAVWTAADIAEIEPIGFREGRVPELDPFRQHALATDRVRYVGEPIAAVFAEDAYIAEDAADLVEIDIQELPAVTDAAVEPSDFDR